MSGSETVRLTKILTQHVDAGVDVDAASGAATTRTVLCKVKDNKLPLLQHHQHFPRGVEQQTFADEAIASMDPIQDSTLVNIPRLFRKDQHQTLADTLHELYKGLIATILDHKGSISLGLRMHSLERTPWYRLSIWTGWLQRKFPKSR
jgi:hypothetical protein